MFEIDSYTYIYICISTFKYYAPVPNPHILCHVATGLLLAGWTGHKALFGCLRHQGPWKLKQRTPKYAMIMAGSDLVNKQLYDILCSYVHITTTMMMMMIMMIIIVITTVLTYYYNYHIMITITIITITISFFITIFITDPLSSRQTQRWWLHRKGIGLFAHQGHRAWGPWLDHGDHGDHGLLSVRMADL